jgi:ABC-type branched-subunit amino acid transport system ATPase component/branched-subunit amino acid ABC-type transport system permease component
VLSDFLPFIVGGIATGAVYGLAGTGLVLTYKTSGIFNFAHGAIAAAAAYLFYFLHVEHGMAWVPAMLISVFGLGPIVGLLFARGAGRIAQQPIALKIVATIGIVLIVQGLATAKFGVNPLESPAFLPHARDTFEFAGVFITYEQVIVTGVAVVAVALLYGLFRWTRTGVAMRAVVDDPDLLTMQATNPDVVRGLSWVIGSTFAALSGVLIAPMVGLDSIGLTFLVVQAFGAAAIGLFASIPLTFLGGLLIGIGSSLSTKYVLDVEWLAGVPSSLPFVVLFVALFVIPRHKLVPPSSIEIRPKPQYRAPMGLRLLTGLVVAVPLLLVPRFVGVNLPYYTESLVIAMMLLSLGLLVRTSGQVSLCHATFAAVGAVAFSQLALTTGLPWLLALLSCGVIAALAGAIVAIPAIRLSGLFLALATLGFGILVQRLFYGQSWMFTDSVSGKVMPKPSFAEDDKNFYYVVLAALVIMAVLVVVIVRSRLGRVLQGMSGSPTAVTAMGLSTNVSKVIVFCISAFMAGIAGALLGMHRGFATSGDAFFVPFESLVLLAMLAVSAFAEPWYAFIAITGVIPAYIAASNTTVWLNVFFGVAALATTFQGGPPPMPDKLRPFFDRLGGRKKPQPPPRAAADLGARVTEDTAGLKVSALTVRFGGLLAVDDVTLEARMGEITGLIGPNGAGKTTTFNACGGLNRRYKGTVELHGRDVSKMSPAARGRNGLGRTFQRVELADTLSVLENVMLGHESSAAGASFLAQLFTKPGERKAAEESAWSALHACGIARLADEQAGALSTGQKRLVELARLLAGPFDVLLLDEPSSGLDHEETERFAELLERVVAERGVAILLVEHDVGLVMRVCSSIHVLDFGKSIFVGTPVQVAASPIVRAAYLGDNAVMTAVEAGEDTTEQVQA